MNSIDKPSPPETTMREQRTIQASIFDVFSQHELGRELKAMSDLLDDHRAVCGSVAAELRRHGLKPTGRKGVCRRKRCCAVGC